MQITDNNGKFIFRELCKAGAQPRGSWVDYLWTNPVPATPRDFLMVS